MRFTLEKIAFSRLWNFVERLDWKLFSTLTTRRLIFLCNYKFKFLFCSVIFFFLKLEKYICITIFSCKYEGRIHRRGKFENVIGSYQNRWLVHGSERKRKASPWKRWKEESSGIFKFCIFKYRLVILQINFWY